VKGKSIPFASQEKGSLNILSSRERYALKTPLVLVIFNRPDTTRRVFEEIRRARPPLLLVVADGPRKDHPSDREQCLKARDVADQVDWDCEVRRNYAETNLGCRRRVSSGLDWVFEQVEEAIILEDDCLPDPTFFRFCEELLERYRRDERIGQISGTNFQFGRKRTEYSYYFSRYYQAWGWASWRRAWKNYDVDMKLWPQIRDGRWLRDWLGRQTFVPYWKYILEKVYRHRIDTWDYQWFFHCWIQNRLAIVPEVNLVMNIGFDEGATHTAGWSKFKKIKTDPMVFPLIHPPYVVRRPEADQFVEVDKHLVKVALFNRVLYGLKGLFGM